MSLIVWPTLPGMPGTDMARRFAATSALRRWPYDFIGKRVGAMDFMRQLYEQGLWP